jgi:hypothetical protein
MATSSTRTTSRPRAGTAAPRAARLAVARPVKVSSRRSTGPRRGCCDRLPACVRSMDEYLSATRCQSRGDLNRW